MEICAGEGTKLCKNLEEFKVIFDLLSSSVSDHVSVCLDTAHIWGSGLYDLSKIDEIDKMFNDFQTILGLSKFKLLHLNDSSVTFGSKKDRHAPPGEGMIWTNCKDVLFHLVNRCNQYSIPIVIETGSINSLYHMHPCP